MLMQMQLYVDANATQYESMVNLLSQTYDPSPLTGALVL
jgi:hypothetical protein